MDAFEGSGLLATRAGMGSVSTKLKLTVTPMRAASKGVRRNSRHRRSLTRTTRRYRTKNCSNRKRFDAHPSNRFRSADKLLRHCARSRMVHLVHLVVFLHGFLR